MRFYKNPDHRYYAGVDLHARSMYVCLNESHDIVRFPDVGNFLSYARLVCVSPYAELTSNVKSALNASRLLTGTVSGRDSSTLNGRGWGT